MNGIAILIWLNELKSLFGIGSKTPYEGGIWINGCIALATFAMASSPALAKLFRLRINMFLPASLLAIILITTISVILDLNVERVTLNESLKSISELQNLLTSNLPTEWSIPLLFIALPFAFQFALLAYIDSLLTSLIVDKKIEEVHGFVHKTKVNKELSAQGIANASISVFGGIPGAQATIRSVLIINEGATTRIAGMMVGIFVLVEMVVFQDLISYIPLAVFSGVLAKVGYEVFDWKPIKNLYQTFREDFSHNQHTGVNSAGIVFIAGTTIVTVFVNLSVAVIVFTILFYLGRRWVPIRYS
jgi:SulP family sulfate permease